MKIKERIKRWSDNNKAKKNSKEPERNPYFMDNYCILKNNIEHQGIGGKKAYFDKTITIDEIVELAAFEGNIGCINFLKRRPDLFNTCEISYLDEPYSQIKPTAKARNKRYHYVKIWNTNEMMYPGYTYLGYVICSDEIKKVYKVKENG